MVYSSGLKKPRAVEPSGLKKTMRHKNSGLAVIKPVDNQITLNPSGGLNSPMHLNVYH